MKRSICLLAVAVITCTQMGCRNNVQNALTDGIFDYLSAVVFTALENLLPIA
jgi:hypothetical protein